MATVQLNLDFSPTVEYRYVRCPRSYNYVLPPKDDKNFIARHLYKLTSKALQRWTLPTPTLTIVALVIFVVVTYVTY